MSLKRLSPPRAGTECYWVPQRVLPSPGSLLLLLSCCVAIGSCCSACSGFWRAFWTWSQPRQTPQWCVFIYIHTDSLVSLSHHLRSDSSPLQGALRAPLRGDFSSLQWKRLRGAQGVLLFVRRMTLRLPSGGSGPMGSQCLLPTFLFSSSP